MHGMLSEGILCYGLEAATKLQYLSIMHAHTHVVVISTTASTYAMSTVTLLDNYKQLFERLYSINYN